MCKIPGNFCCEFSIAYSREFHSVQEFAVALLISVKRLPMSRCGRIPKLL